MASTMMAQDEVQNYGYNTRDELISGQGLTYNYDDIGNRTTAEGKTYTANNLNQYTAIDTFEPQYDADGNQTLIKTSAGVWSVTYNAENRPVRWVKDNTVITMNFDRMGRRVFYKEEVNGVVTKHHRFVYDNYLCVQKVDALNNNSQINLFVWDPTELIATRPLFTTGSGNRKFFYTCDGNKNVSELVHFETRNGIAAHYDYAPFGAVTRAISASTITDNTFTTDNPCRFSSEYHDDTLGLVYYRERERTFHGHYRHYNPIDGRWCGRDPKIDECYSFSNNNPIFKFDFRGLMSAYYCLDKNCKMVEDEGFPKESKFIALLVILQERKCSIPRIKCQPCSNDAMNGYYNSTNNQIILCNTKRRKKEEYQTTLLHELSHAKDRCLSTVDVDCEGQGLEERACTEARAYRYANLIIDQEKLINAIMSSIIQACPRRFQGGHRDEDALLMIAVWAAEKYANLSLDSLTPFPKEDEDE